MTLPAVRPRSPFVQALELASGVLDMVSESPPNHQPTKALELPPGIVTSPLIAPAGPSRKPVEKCM